MSVLKIVKYGHPILRQVAQPVTQIDPALKQLVEDMFETMRDADGIGLAGPQVGKSIRLFVVDVTPITEGFPPMTFINPEILSAHGMGPYTEGCLSIPGVSAEVARPEKVEIRYTDIDGKTVQGVAEGILARVIQHELDHLNGRLFIDYLDEATLAEFQPILEKLNETQTKVRAGRAL